MTLKPSGQNSRRFIQLLLRALLLVATTAGDIGDTGNDSPSAPPPILDPPRQRPQIVYQPHGIQIKIPTAPFPARRNWPHRQGRPRPFGQPPEVPMALDPLRLPQIKGPDFPPGYQGPRGNIGPQLGFAAPPAPGPKRYELHLPQISGSQFPPGYQGPLYLGSHQAFSPPLGLMRGFNPSPLPQMPGPQFPPGYQGPRYLGSHQAFSPPLGVMKGFNPSRLPQFPGPQFPPGYQGPRSEPQMDPWFRLPVPTPLGPYSERRPVQSLPIHFEPQPPLRDLDGLKPRNTVNSSEEWHPDDTWQGAQAGKVVRPPSPEQLRALVPPAVRVRGAGGDRPDPDQVGYVDAPEEDAADDSVQYSEEKDDVTSETSLRPTARGPRYAPRGLPRASPAAAPPPPLLAADAWFHEEAAFGDDAPTSADAERFSNKAVRNVDDAERFSDGTPGELSAARRGRSDTFDHLLLL